jgi:hypothetical protein
MQGLWLDELSMTTMPHQGNERFTRVVPGNQSILFAAAAGRNHLKSQTQP